MTLERLIQRVDALVPNTYTNDEKMFWASELEGMIQLEIFLLAPDSIRVYDDYAADKNKELLVRPPYDKIYIDYLIANIHNTNGEYAAYQNALEKYNADWAQFAKWVIDRIDPADRKAVWHGYYLVGEKGDTGGEGPLYRHQLVMSATYDGYTYVALLALYTAEEDPYVVGDLETIVTTYGVDRGTVIQIGVNGYRMPVAPPYTKEPIIFIGYDKGAGILDNWTENITEFIDDVESIY